MKTTVYARAIDLRSALQVEFDQLERRKKQLFEWVPKSDESRMEYNAVEIRMNEIEDMIVHCEAILDLADKR